MVRARRRPDHLGPVALAQLIGLEVLIISVLALLGHGWLAVIAAMLGAGAVAPGFIRVGGRWLPERVLLRRRYRRRQPPALGDDPNVRLAALRSLAPDLTLRTVTLPSDAAVGVGQDNGGWFAAAVVMPQEGFATVPVDQVVRAMTTIAQPGAVAQFLVHTVPAPSGVIDIQHRAATSYRQLLYTHGAVPAARTMWLAVRLDAGTVAQVAADPDELGHAPTVVASMLRRFSLLLGRASLSCHLLDADELADAAAGCYDLKPWWPKETPPLAVEEWRCWRSARLAHVCYWMRQWPSPEAATALLSQLAVETAASITFSLTVQIAEGGDAEVRCLIRVAALPPAVEQACLRVEAAAGRLQVGLLRMDGEHAPAVYATGPTGGGVG